MAGETATEVRSRRFGRFALVGFGLLAVAALAGPPVLRAWIDRDLCPTVVTRSGVSDGTRWEVARSDCGGGRIVQQLRVVPPKGWSTLVYETEGGPLPLAWSQTGFVGKLELERPLDDESSVVIDVPLDARGRPKEAIRTRAGRRLPPG